MTGLGNQNWREEMREKIGYKIVGKIFILYLFLFRYLL
jgi:hypothetical protein